MALDEQASVRDAVLGHLPLVTTGLIFTFVFARLFVIAHGNIETARAMLSASGPVEIVFGILLVALPLVGAAIVLMGAACLGRSNASSIRIYGVVGILVGLLVTALTAPWVGLVAELGLGVYVAFVFWSDGLVARSYRGPIVLPILLPIVLFVFFADDPWVPAERISLERGRYVVGYVLGSEDDSLVVLTENDRLVERIEMAEIQSRQVCVLGEELHPLLKLWRDDRTYPRC